MTTITPISCRVCRHPDTVPFMTVRDLRYRRCPRCEATLLDADQLPDAASQEKRYRLHRNDPDDEGYKLFLGKIMTPLLAILPPGSVGLDYGCGPGPALVGMMRAAGHSLYQFDPLFFPSHDLLERSYDFLTCTEVMEHLHHPAEELDKLNRLVHPGGLLGFTTCFQSDDAQFANWSYRRDFTHVVFYREHTFRVLARQFDWTCEVPEKNVVIMRKK